MDNESTIRVETNDFNLEIISGTLRSTTPRVNPSQCIGKQPTASYHFTESEIDGLLGFPDPSPDQDATRRGSGNAAIHPPGRRVERSVERSNADQPDQHHPIPGSRSN